MEENIDAMPPGEGAVKERLKKEAEALEKDRLEATRRKITVEQLRRERVRKFWEENMRKRREAGQNISKEEEEVIRKKMEKGEMPVISGGSGDGKFENFPADKYKETGLEELAAKLKKAGENNADIEELRKEIEAKLHEVAGGGKEYLSNEFIKDFERARTGRDAQPEGNQSQGGGAASAPSEKGSAVSVQDLVKQALDKREARSTNPRSIQQVALTIINDEGADRWGPDGRFPLLDEHNNLIQENFIRWFRERMMYHHINNSRDPQLQMGNLVGVESELGGTISVFKMDSNRGQYFKDQNTGEIYDKLADQMKMELWLFGNMRNHDLVYQEYMGSDADLPKYLAQLHNKEEITLKDSLKTIMTMSKDYGKKIQQTDAAGRPVFDKEGKAVMVDANDTIVGDAVRKSYEIYYYASDFEKLQEILGPNSIFFRKEGFENAFKIIEKIKGTDSNISPAARLFINKIFKDGVLDRGAFIKELNPFNLQNKPEFNKTIMREMVRQSVAEKYGLEYGLYKDTTPGHERGKIQAPERDFLRKDLEYAEAWAWVLTRWTGAAAMNDTDAVGYDALTKAMKLRDYRVRQSSEERAAAFGNEYDLPVIKSTITDFFNAVTVEKKDEDDGGNLTPFEVFRKIDEQEDEISKIMGGRPLSSLSLEERQKALSALNPEDLKKVKEFSDAKEYWEKRLQFEQFTQKGYVANHLNRGFEMLHSTLGAEEMKLEEIVKWDPFRGVILDRGKFEEQVKEKFLKPIRYGFSTHAQLDFGKMTRVKRGNNPDGTPRYDDVTFAEKHFGPEVTGDLRLMAEKTFKKEINAGKMTSQEAWQEYLSKTVKNGGGRDLLWKRAAMAKMAAHIKSHRQFANGYTPFSAGMVETLYDALESIKSMEIDEDDDETMNYDKRFLTKADIQWIRKHSGTTKKDLFMKDFLLKGVGGGAAKGIWEGAGMILKDILKG